MDREKVIKLFEQYINDFVPCCSTDDYDLDLFKTVLALLKEQEDLGTELTNAVELIHKKNERIEKLLKEQEHGETFTVIDTKTGKEADEYNIALHEEWAKHLCYCDMEGWAIENDGTLLLVDECGRFAYADRERFKVVWDD